jgi:hypothetical protein
MTVHQKAKLTIWVLLVLGSWACNLSTQFGNPNQPAVVTVVATPPTPSPWFAFVRDIQNQVKLYQAGADQLDQVACSLDEFVKVAQAAQLTQPVDPTVAMPLKRFALLTTDVDSTATIQTFDNSVLKLAPQTQILLRNQSPDGKILHICLYTGQIWIVSSPSEFQVNTPNGLAALGGSYASVLFGFGDPNNTSDDQTVLGCLYGNCVLALNSAGDVRVQLHPNEQSSIVGSNPPSEITPLNRNQLLAWQSVYPQSTAVFPAVMP